MDISVIVLSKNNGKTLDTCLSSITQAEPSHKEIVVVDAHSIDETPSILKKYKGKVKVSYDEGKGIGIARNIGVTQTKGEIVCFVDADAVVSKDHFIKIKNYFISSPKVGVVHVTPRFLGGETYLENMGNLYGLLSKDISERTAAAGCFMSIRRKTFDDIGGFWKFPPYGVDDHEFCLRAREKKWEIGEITCDSYHKPRATLGEFFKEIWASGKGEACLVKKYYSHPLFLKDREGRKMFKLLKSKFWVGYIIPFFLAPIYGLKYMLKSKRVDFYMYYVFRACVYGLGYFWGWLTWTKRVTTNAWKSQ